jgi:hypothetical protein
VQDGETRPALFGSHNVQAWLKNNNNDFDKLVHFAWHREEQFKASYQLIEKENQSLLNENKRLNVDQFYIEAYDAELERVKAIATQTGGSAVDEFRAGLHSIQQAYLKENSEKAKAASIMQSLLDGKIASLKLEVQRLQKRNSELEEEILKSKLEIEQLQRKLESQEADCSPEIEPEWFIPDPDEEEVALDKALQEISEELDYYTRRKAELESKLHEARAKLVGLEQKLGQLPKLKPREEKDVLEEVDDAKKNIVKLENNIKNNTIEHDKWKVDKQAKEPRRDQLRNERTRNRTRSASHSFTDSGSRSRGTGFSSLGRKTSSTNATELTSIAEASESPPTDQQKQG